MTSELDEYYKPKKFLVEEQIIFDDTGFSGPVWRTPIQTTYSMYYSI